MIFIQYYASLCFNYPWGVFLLNTCLRSSRPKVFCESGVLKYFTIFIGKHLCWSLLQIPTGLQLYWKRLQDRSFHVNIAKFLRTPILKNIYKRLLLMFQRCFENFFKIVLYPVKHLWWRKCLRKYLHGTKNEVFH